MQASGRNIQRDRGDFAGAVAIVSAAVAAQILDRNRRPGRFQAPSPKLLVLLAISPGKRSCHQGDEFEDA
jgi:hypothetical protein